jgi:hypothetical protein
MGFRFRKYFGVLPGVRVNLGKKRVSVSIGVRGLTANISKDGIRKTASVPGTGLSYSSYQKHPEAKESENEIRPFVLYGVILAIVGIAAVVVTVIVLLLKNN